jgi:hypothetical protein
MRMVTLGMVLMATIVASAWSLTHTTALTFRTQVDSPAAMNPLGMMETVGELPVSVFADLI